MNEADLNQQSPKISKKQSKYYLVKFVSLLTQPNNVPITSSKTLTSDRLSTSAITNIKTRLIVQIAAQFKAAQFKNGNRYKNAISENLERWEWFGILHCHQDGQIKYWQHIESQQAS